jgi:hypothetical protein
MKKDYCCSVLLPLVLITVGGLLTLAICYLLYFGVYTLVETVFYPNKPTAVPAGIIRTSYCVALLALYLVLLRTKLSDLFKATIFIGPMTMLVITAILVFYETKAFAAAAIVAIALSCMFLLYRVNKPWIYYYAAAASVLVAIIYAWPQA